ncbi:DnaB-like helicase C-terminal domain-containing protein [Pontiellaceae bacterium B1224]|nr:DnaB-like helicase C-terminal domain-containing protein [Pontiellaceae bacterium B1224]
MDYATIKQHVSMERLLDHYNIERDSHGRCACPLHGGDNKTAFSIHSQAQGWTCHTKCDASGDIFSFVERLENITNAEAKIRIEEMFNLAEPKQNRLQTAAMPPPRKSAGRIIGRKEYHYRNVKGETLYTVKRVDYEGGRKDCFQDCQGKPTLPPDIRTLYNLDLILGNTEDFIVLCEGEKTADALTECDYIGTTNPLGSKNWDPKYAELLRGQKVVVMPDADEHGEKWRNEVLQSLQGVAEQVQVITMPDSFIHEHHEFTGHDFADFLAVKGKKDATLFMIDSLMETAVLPMGVDPELLGRPADDFARVLSRAQSGMSTAVFNFNEWLPSMNLDIMRGDLVVLMANTGVGKTRCLHNLPFHIRRLNFAIFDLELSRETLALRYGAMENKVSFNALKQRIDSGQQVKGVSVDNVYIQKVPNLSPDKIRERVALLEKVTGREIHAVGVDYIGLMSGKGSAYERTSTNVEDFKAYVSEVGKVGILTTQVRRPDDPRGLYKCPEPFAAKNSGSIENSTQAMFGFWKDEHHPNRLWTANLKYSHGETVMKPIPLDAHDLLISEAKQ